MDGSGDFDKVYNWGHRSFVVTKLAVIIESQVTIHVQLNVKARLAQYVDVTVGHWLRVPPASQPARYVLSRRNLSQETLAVEAEMVAVVVAVECCQLAAVREWRWWRLWRTEGVTSVHTLHCTISHWATHQYSSSSSSSSCCDVMWCDVSHSHSQLSHITRPGATYALQYRADYSSCPNQLYDKGGQLGVNPGN